ncbi:MAG: sigma-70 family RNA polymerase sigma factor [Lentisphaeria bacterium]|nr:sigma-70 family RNA polymerase sigma factor [Lentisphaeria bacterium]
MIVTAQNKLISQKCLKMLRDQEPDAAEFLAKNFSSRIFGLALRITQNHSDAEEIVQETLTVVWNKWSTFREDSDFSSWIFRIAANQAYMKLRKSKRQSQMFSLNDLATQTAQLIRLQKQSLFNTSFVKETQKPDELLEKQELHIVLQKEIDALPEKFRLVLVLKDIEGLQLKDICEILDLSLSAVKSRLHRARKLLRDRLIKLNYKMS